jgi:glutamine synthetase
MAYTEKQWKADVEVAKAVLKETYVNNIVYVQERVKEGAKEEELKQIEDLIMANERLIVYFDEGDEWVKEAKKRGLPNLKTVPESLKETKTPAAIKLFESQGVHGILPQEEHPDAPLTQALARPEPD